MHIARIDLTNFGPYRGKHSLKLEATVYSVLARRDDDELRSNAQGKTWFVWAIRFALYGSRPPGARTEDDWITHDEPAGGVRVVLSDGTVVQRTRQRGKSTQLQVKRGENESNQDQAQENIEQLLGMNERDLEASCFFEQKEIARLVMDSGDRTEMVTAWLELEPVQEAASYVAEELAKHLAQLEKLAQRAAVVRETRGRAMLGAGFTDQAGIGDVEADAERAANEQQQLEARLARGEQHQRDTIAAHSEWRTQAAAAKEFDEVVAKGMELKAALDAEAEPQPEDDAIEQQAEARRLFDQTTDRARQLKLLVHGKFDGHCPVMNEECPVSETVSNAGRRKHGEWATAEEQRRKSEDEYRRLCAVTTEVRQANAHVQSLNTHLSNLRERARRLQPAKKYVEQHPEPTPPGFELQPLREQVTEGAIKLRAVEQLAANLQAWEAELAELAATEQVLAGTITTHREAMAVLGRNGAQRDIAQGALADIQDGANELLARCGIELQIDVTWGRTAASGLAVACDQCGAPYPPSQRPKQCSACGAPRGPKTIDRLDVELSDRSGALEDLAGVALQLSAAAWLRGRRGAGWSVAILDEAFAALDASMRPRLASHLAGMLRSQHSFAQAFCVSHSVDVQEAFPAAIQITGSATGSRIEVL